MQFGLTNISIWIASIRSVDLQSTELQYKKCISNKQNAIRLDEYKHLDSLYSFWRFVIDRIGMLKLVFQINLFQFGLTNEILFHRQSTSLLDLFRCPICITDLK